MIKFKAPFAAVFWTFGLAIPFTFIALAGVAYIDLHFSEITLAILNFEQAVTAGGRGFIAEFAQRFPEVLGMLIGMIVIVTIYAFVRQPAESAVRQKR
ncbi:MAG: hypothetical protein QM730_14770 [Anaerolineales bacterium]